MLNGLGGLVSIVSNSAALIGAFSVMVKPIVKPMDRLQH